jgi:hypothetical protein
MLGQSDELNTAGLAAWSRGGKQNYLSPAAALDAVTP